MRETNGTKSRRALSTAQRDDVTSAVVAAFIQQQLACLARPPSDDQLSMIASAIAGGQPLCCAHHEYREAIAETPEELATIVQFANLFTGCQFDNLDKSEQGVRIARYLHHLVMWDGEHRDLEG
jgi:hypothetical protein